MIYVDEFIESKRNENLQDATIKEYIYYLGQFENWLLKYFDKAHFTKTSFKAIKRPHIQKYIDDIRDSGKSKSTAQKNLAYIKEFIYFLEGKELIDSYCVYKIKLKKDKGITKIKRHMTIEQGWHFYNSITDKRDKLIVAFALFHGLRRSEIAELKVENINTDNWKMLFIRKNQREEELTLQEQVRELVLEQLEFCKQHKHVYLFQSPKFNKPKPISVVTVWKVFKDWLEIAGLGEFDFSTHDGRRFFALSLYEEGYSDREISIAMSHLSESTTKRYINVQSNKVMDKIGNRPARMDD